MTGIYNPILEIKKPSLRDDKRSAPDYGDS